MRAITLMALLVAGFVLAGCATRYQAKTGMSGGYSEAPLGSGTYRVAFEANGATSVNRVNDYLILRCARLTLEKGYRYFAFLGDSQSYDSGGIKYFSTVIRLFRHTPKGLPVLDAQKITASVDAKYKLNPSN